METKICYLNIDLALESKYDLRPLAHTLTKQGLHTLTTHQGGDGLWIARLETEAHYTTPERHATGLLKAIKALEGRGRELWDSCSSREFDIGFECGETPTQLTHLLKPNTLAQMATANVALRITLYPRERTVP